MKRVNQAVQGVTAGRDIRERKALSEIYKDEREDG